MVSSGHRQGETSIETIPGSTELYHREPHREGAPGPLCYHPYIHRLIKSSDRLVADWETILRPKVLDAIKEHDISPRAITPIHQFGAPSSPVKGRETILISAPSHEHKNDNWFLAISDIRRFFASVGWENLIVEISDYGEMRLYTWAIQQDELIVEQWADIRGVLLEQLAVDEAAALESISIFRRGKSHKRTECLFTIVLTAPEVYGLMNIKDQIRRTLDSHGYRHIGLEIIRDRLTRNSIVHIDPFSMDNYQLGAGIGASIGIKDSLESGTLGGYIYLRDASGRKQLGLTCYHVVRPGIPECQRPDCDSSGISTSSKTGRSVVLIQPSRVDHDDTMKARESCIASIEETIEKIGSRIADMKMKILHGAKPENYPQRFRSALKHQESQLLELKQLLSSSREFYSQTSDFGHIFAASGFRRSAENHQIDWALIELDETRKPPNLNIPTHDKSGETLAWFTELYKPHSPTALERKVWMKGRTTGFTRGSINHLKTDVFPNGIGSKQVLTEWVIVDESRAWASFSRPGDSGAMILNVYSQLVGMLIGGFPASGFSYMTPYATLVADIERQTGAKVKIEGDSFPEVVVEECSGRRQ